MTAEKAALQDLGVSSDELAQRTARMDEIARGGKSGLRELAEFHAQETNPYNRGMAADAADAKAKRAERSDKGKPRKPVAAAEPAQTGIGITGAQAQEIKRLADVVSDANDTFLRAESNLKHAIAAFHDFIDSLAK